MFDLSKYGFTKFHETTDSCFWEMIGSNSFFTIKIVVLSSTLDNGNWCYDICAGLKDNENTCDSNMLTIASRYECETKEQLDFLILGSHRLREFISAQG